MIGPRGISFSYPSCSRVVLTLLSALPFLAVVDHGVFASAFCVTAVIGLICRIYLAPNPACATARWLIPTYVVVLGGLLSLGAEVFSRYFNETFVTFLFTATALTMQQPPFPKRDVPLDRICLAAVVVIAAAGIAMTLVTALSGLSLARWTLIGDRENKLIFLLLPIAWFAAYGLAASSKRWFAYALLGGTGLIASLSAALTAAVGFGVGLGIFFLALRRPKRARLVVLILPLAPLAIAILDRYVLFHGVPNVGSSSWGVRLELWDAALKLFWRAPVIGNGIDTFRELVGTVIEPGYRYLRIQEHPHSWFMQIVADCGLIGALVVYWGLAKLTALQHYAAERQAWFLAAFASALTCLSISLSAWSDYSIGLMLLPVMLFSWWGGLPQQPRTEKSP